MRKFLSFLILLIGSVALADAPLIWDGTLARFLTPGGFKFPDSTKFLVLTSDPTAGGGYSATSGSIGLRSTGQAYLKTGTSDTAWSLFVTGSALTASRALVSNASGLISAATTTSTEIGYVNGTTGSIQNQLNARQLLGNYVSALTGDVSASGPSGGGSAAATISNLTRTKLATGNAYRILANDVSGAISENAALTASRAIASDANGQLAVSSTTSTELGYVNGTTGSIQNQINARQLLGNYLSALTGDVTATGPSGGGSGATTITNLTRTKLATGNAYRILANGSGGAISENAAITGNRAVASDVNGQLVAATTTDTELGYVSGTTSSIQTQINARIRNPLGTNGQVLTLVGSVWTAATPSGSTPTVATVSGNVRVVAFQLAAPSAGSCAIIEEGGDSVNGTPSSAGTGRCLATFNSGVFDGSTIPVCVCGAQSVGTTATLRSCQLTSTTTTVETIITDAVTAQASDRIVICYGPQP